MLFKIWGISGTYYITVHISCLPIFNSSVLIENWSNCLSKAACDVASTSEHLFPAVSEKGGTCGVAMVKRILPDPPAAKDLPLFWTHWVWRHLAKASFGVYGFNLIFVLHSFSDYPFSGLSWVRVTTSALNTRQASIGGWLGMSTTWIHRGNELWFTLSGNHISENAGFFFSWALRGLHLFLTSGVDGCMPPSAASGALGDGCPLTSCWLLAGGELPEVSSGQTAYWGPSQWSRAATFHSHTAADRIVQAKLPVAVCHLLYKRSWGPGGEVSLFMRVCSTCREAGDNLSRWNQSFNNGKQV